MIHGFISMEQKKYIYHFLYSNSCPLCALQASMKSPGQQLGGIAIVSTAFPDIPFVMQRFALPLSPQIGAQSIFRGNYL